MDFLLIEPIARVVAVLFTVWLVVRFSNHMEKIRESHRKMDEEERRLRERGIL